MKKMFRAPRNKVIIKISDMNDSITLSNGVKLFIDTQFEPAEHTPVVGEVVGVSRLYYNESDPENSMEWETDMQLKVGDTVFMEYFAVHQCLGTKIDRNAAYENPKWFTIDGVLYITISYQDIYFAVRNEEVILLNGYSIVRPIYVNKVESDTIIIPNSLKHKKSPKFCEVILPGKPVKRYLDKKYRDFRGLSAGSIAMFMRWAVQRVEVKLHKTNIVKWDDYHVLQRRWVLDALPTGYKSSIENGKLK